MGTKIELHDKIFEKFISHGTIQESVARLAERINGDYRDRPTPVFLGVLNGSFMFMAELVKGIDFECEVSFVKLASYSGVSSSEDVLELIGLNNNLLGRDIIIVEDIVETGNSIEHLTKMLREHNPSSVEVATLLLKPDSYKKNVPIKYFALSIPDDFIVGFGLDYNELGRNLTDIYKLLNDK